MPTPPLLTEDDAAAGRGAGRDTMVCALALAGLTVATTPDRRLGLGFVGAVATAAGLFRLFGLLTTRLARLVPRRRPGRVAVALRALGRPGNRQAGRILAALGLGLSILCALGQVDANFSQALVSDIPRQAPAFFFLDIQPGQREAFEKTVRSVPGVGQLDVSPMKDSCGSSGDSSFPRRRQPGRETRVAAWRATMVESLKDKMLQADLKSREAAAEAAKATQALDSAAAAARRAEAGREAILGAARELQEVVQVVSSASQALADRIAQANQGAQVQDGRIGETATAMGNGSFSTSEVRRYRA